MMCMDSLERQSFSSRPTFKLKTPSPSDLHCSQYTAREGRLWALEELLWGGQMGMRIGRFHAGGDRGQVRHGAGLRSPDRSNNAALLSAPHAWDPVKCVPVLHQGVLHSSRRLVPEGPHRP